MSDEVGGRKKTAVISMVTERDRFLVMGCMPAYHHQGQLSLSFPSGDNFESMFETPEQTASRVCKIRTSLTGHCFRLMHSEVGADHVSCFFTCAIREKVGPDWMQRVDVALGESVFVRYWDLGIFWEHVSPEHKPAFKRICDILDSRHPGFRQMYPEIFESIKKT